MTTIADIRSGKAKLVPGEVYRVEGEGSVFLSQNKYLVPGSTFRYVEENVPKQDLTISTIEVSSREDAFVPVEWRARSGLWLPSLAQTSPNLTFVLVGPQAVGARRRRKTRARKTKRRQTLRRK